MIADSPRLRTKILIHIHFCGFTDSISAPMQTSSATGEPMSGTITIEQDGDWSVTLDDMGKGHVVLSQFSEVTGRVERIAGDRKKLLAALLAAENDHEPKNTDQREEIEAA